MFVIAQGETSEGTCSSCGLKVWSEGPGLWTTLDARPVCRECGRRYAPTLAALLDLAQVALRIGRIQGHAPFRVPMESLLELARVSERYFSLITSGSPP